MPQITGMVSHNNNWGEKDAIRMDVEEPLAI
jgi:hypothetical protein